MYWYYNFLVRQPYLMVLAITVLCLACIIVSLTSNTLPDFSDPTLGFETRGTEIGNRLIAWQNLLQETGTGGTLVADPNDLQYINHLDDLDYTLSMKRKHRRNRKKKKQNYKNKSNDEQTKKILTLNKGIHDPQNDNGDELDRIPSQWNGDNGVFRDYEITNDSWSSIIEQKNKTELFEYGRNMTFVDDDYHREKVQYKKSTWRILKQAAEPPLLSDKMLTPIHGYFCESPDKEFSHFVVERLGPNATDSLFDLNGLLAMCQLHNRIIAVENYQEYCLREMLTKNCCRPWSLPNYAAMLANKSSCFNLTNEDVTELQNLLVVCFKYIHKKLVPLSDCSEYNRCNAPAECTRHNIVFEILYYLTDYNFIKINDTNIFLKYSIIYVPVIRSTKILPLFHAWEQVKLKNEFVQVVAMDMGLENELFNEYLITDSWLVALGGVFIMACMWLYTTSIFITAMTCAAVVFSVGLAYFVYTLVFEMTFFPYMNLLALVVVVGIGTDDAFIFIKIWQCVLAERFTKSSTVTTQSLSNIETEYTETLQDLMARTLRHAAISMFVTSITTACAFYASFVSSITAIKCFGVFAGTAVIANYLLMVTWLPASVSITERFTACRACSKLQIQQFLLMANKSINKFCIAFEKKVTSTVMKYSVSWMVIFATVGFGSAVIVLYWPSLQLPENAHFQLFASKHPFEVYNTKLKNQFWFEKSISSFENFKMPLRFVWGIQPVDDGDYANPYSHGTLHYDNNFNISTKAAQTWLSNFCENLKLQPFYQLTFGLLLPNCFIENFRTFMQRMCIDSMDGTDRTPCCDISKFPYEPHIFDLCLPQSISSLYATPREFFIPGVAGPKFAAATQNTENTSNEEFEENSNFSSSSPPLVKALVIEFESNMSFTTGYHDVKSFIGNVELWFSKQLRTAPKEMNGGWFISELKFFDVQDTLSRGTIIAIALAMTASFIVLLLSTLNVLISLYAVITVTFTIFTIVSILIVLGWKLNVLESVTVSTAIGLAVDFSLHYGIHFRLCPTSERIASTRFALSRIIGPTAMAAVTTGIAGTLMLTSNVLPYIQIGIFLVVAMTVSWLYATFFLMSLLKLAGPQYGFMQFNYPRINQRPATNGIKFYERKQSHIIASEQLLTPSSSAVGDLINSETHELESLTSSSLIKTISGTESFHPLSIDVEHSFQNKNDKNFKEHIPATQLFP